MSEQPAVQRIHVVSQSPDAFAHLVGREAIDELHALARPLRGLRVLQLNATSYGGGVSELLRSQVPLMRGLGLAVDWATIRGEPAFFRVTKGLHNALQGAPTPLTPEATALYLETLQRNAQTLTEPYDVMVVHDPQPAALRAFLPQAAGRWVWRWHIDTAAANPEIWAF